MGGQESDLKITHKKGKCSAMNRDFLFEERRAAIFVVYCDSE